MINKFLSVFLIFFSWFSFAQSWTQLQDFTGTERDDASIFTIGSKVYCGTGLQVGWTCTNDFYAFDLATETWGSICSMPTLASRQYGIGFSILGKGYVFGGVNDLGTYLNDLWEYNPTTNTWLQKSNMPSLGRAGIIAFVINDIVYIIGGRTSINNAIPETWMYNPLTDIWTQLTNIPINGTWRGVSFTYNNKGYIGLGKNNFDQYNKLFFEYNPTTNIWNNVIGYSHIGRVYSGYSQIGNYGYLFGGADSLGFIDNTFEKIDLSDFSTLALSPFISIARKGCVSFVNNNSFYISTGVSSTARFKETWKASDIVGITESKKVDELMLFPNPAKNKITISIKNEEIISVKIYDYLGQEVLKVNSGFTNIDVSQIAQAGIYSVHILLGNGVLVVRKLIIE